MLHAMVEGGHTMRVTLEDDQVILTPQCHKPEGASCRVHCPQGCATWELTGHEHELVSRSCLAVEYFTESDSTVYSCEPADGSAIVSLRDGMPIEVEWEGECWTWSPVAES